MEARREEAQARANGLQQENREAAHESYKLALAAVDAYDYEAALRRAERAVRLSPGTRAYEELLTSLQLLAEEEAEEEESEEEGEEESEEEGEGEGEEAVEDVEVGAEEVTSLIEILQGRLEPLRKTGNADRKLLRQPADNRAVEAADSEEVSSRRREYVAMYREGLRDVLREAVESLQEMLLGAMADSEGEDEEGVEAEC